ncbi:hypothetical protein EMCRGX_G002161 [Ephydatia muelleri]|eukprot:Em0001g1943a
MGLLAPIAICLHYHGMQDQPNSWHLGPLECSLQASAARAATPAWSLKMAEQSGEVMVRSSARRFASVPASNESVSRSGVGKVSGHSMGIQRIKCSVEAEWAHGPAGSIHSQPPPNGHLLLI